MKNLSFRWCIPLLATILLSIQLADAQKIKISPGANLVLNKNVSLVVMNCAIINNGNILPGSASSVYFRGKGFPGSISGSATNLNNLNAENSSSAPLIISTPVSVTGILSLVNGNSKIITNDQLTLKSTYTKTAMVNTVPAGGDISGKVTVERFIQAHRSWRLLTVPVSTAGAPTLKASWQEGAGSVAENPYPGYGTHITGATSPGNGFDFNSGKSINCKFLWAGAWVGVANTNVVTVTDHPGYMLFVRGSRANNLSQGVNAVADNTVLRASGNLHIGSKTYVVNSTGFTIVGNPYAAPIDFATITKDAHVLNTFYVWDPMLTGNSGVGGYVTVNYNGSAYVATTSVSPVDQYIQSGSAFLVKSDGLAGSITIKESDKSAQNSITLQRPVGVTRQLRADLYLVNPDASTALYDGVLVGFNGIFTNDIDNFDADKLSNGLAGISLIRNNKSLSIESRKPLDAGKNDTLFFKLSQMTANNYRLQIKAENLNYPNTIAFLEDVFLNNQTVLKMDGTTPVPFSVTSSPGSYATNRFRIVFTNTGTLASSFLALEAAEINDNIALAWKVDNEMNVLKYEVERSANSQQFNNIGSLPVIRNNEQTNRYQWLDVNPEAGVYFYRIKQISISGQFLYSKIVKIDVRTREGQILVNSNTIADNSIFLQLNQQPKGNYNIQVKNNIGQLVFIQKIQHSGGSRTETLLIDQQLSAGIYFLEVVGPDSNSKTIKLLKQ